MQTPESKGKGKDGKKMMQTTLTQSTQPDTPKSPQNIVVIKRPSNSYTHFYQQNYNLIKEQNPGIKVTEMGKIAGEMYRKLSPEELEKYNELSKKDYERYEKER